MIGSFAWRKRGQPWRRQRNLITDEGRDFLNGEMLASTNPILYCAPFGNNVTPTTAWTGATFAATAGELGDAPEGYEETTRAVWSPQTYFQSQFDADDPNVDPDGPLILRNHGLTGGFIIPMSFRIISASTIDVYGFGMLTTDTKQDTAGKLVSALRFVGPPVPEVYGTGDILDIYYQLTQTAE